MFPRVAIIILNWNKKNDLLTLLSILKDINYRMFDIFVVDNGSTDGSVEAVKKEYPHVVLIEHDENLGGTEGFNTGLKYACRENRYKYAWLLDNDALVKEDTLCRLVEVMEADETIGLAGSRITDKNDRNFVVEMGGMLRRDIIGVRPLIQYPEKGSSDLVLDVDYVATCSALVRISALDKVGLMDERFFIFWDDIDWGISFKEHGFRVVSVYKSVVYHDSFLEKDRGDYTNFYYGIRNPLLLYAKHFGFSKMMLILVKYMPVKCMQMSYYLFAGQHLRAYLIYKAFADFCFDRWGYCNVVRSRHNYKRVFSVRKKNVHKVLILAGSGAETRLVKRWCDEQLKDAKIYLFIQRSRKNMYSNGFPNIISIEDKKIQDVSYWSRILVKLLFERFDLVVKPYSSIFSFLSFVGKKSFYYENGVLLEDRQDQKHIGFLPASFLAGLIFSFVATFTVLLSCRRYKK